MECVLEVYVLAFFSGVIVGFILEKWMQFKRFNNYFWTRKFLQLRFYPSFMHEEIFIVLYNACLNRVINYNEYFTKDEFIFFKNYIWDNIKNGS